MVKEAAAALAGSGIAVEEARPPAIEQTYEIYLGLFTADGGAGIESLLAEAGTRRVHPLMQRVLDLQHQGALSMAEFGEADRTLGHVPARNALLHVRL